MTPFGVTAGRWQSPPCTLWPLARVTITEPPTHSVWGSFRHPSLGLINPAPMLSSALGYLGQRFHYPGLPNTQSSQTTRLPNTQGSLTPRAPQQPGLFSCRGSMARVAAKKTPYSGKTPPTALLQAPCSTHQPP